jgi:transcriptional regulator with XRE-family HTH domain
VIEPPSSPDEAPTGEAAPEEHPILVRFGQQVRDLRLHAGLTQEELATTSGLHWTYISQIERGKRNLTYKCLVRLAAGLGITLSQLVDGQQSDHDPGPLRGWERRLFLS